MRTVLIVYSLFALGAQGQDSFQIQLLCRPAGNVQSTIVCKNNAAMSIVEVVTQTACSSTQSSPCADSSADSLAKSWLLNTCKMSEGSNICNFYFSDLPANISACAISGVNVNYSCGNPVIEVPKIAATSPTTEIWQTNYTSWQFIVIWCIIGCVVAVITISSLLLACGCCPRCHRYTRPNSLSKLAMLSVSLGRSVGSSGSTLDRTAFQFTKGSDIGIAEGRGQSDGRSDSGIRTPDGSVTGTMGGRLAGSQFGLDKMSTLSRQSQPDSGYRTGTLGGRVTAAQGPSDRGSTLSRQSAGQGVRSAVTLDRMPSHLSKSLDALADDRDTMVLRKQNSLNDEGDGLNEVEFGTKKRGKHDPQMEYFGQKHFTTPAETNFASLKRPQSVSLNEIARPQRLFQKNGSTIAKDGARPDMSLSPDGSIDKATAADLPDTSRSSKLLAASSLQVLGVQIPVRAATLSRLQVKARDSGQLAASQPGQTSTLSRVQVKVHENNRSLTMPLNQAVAEGYIVAGDTPLWSIISSTSTLSRLSKGADKRPVLENAAAPVITFNNEPPKDGNAPSATDIQEPHRDQGQIAEANSSRLASGAGIKQHGANAGTLHAHAAEDSYVELNGNLQPQEEIKVDCDATTHRHSLHRQFATTKTE